MLVLEVLKHPEDHVDCKPGSSIKFSISATPSAAHFQWYFQERPIQLNNSDYEGATETVLCIPECLSKHQGQYKCAVSDEPGLRRVDSGTASLVLGKF